MPAVILKMCCCVQHYADNDLKLRRFVPIIQRSLVYPVILDATRTVLSLPPIINGAHSAVRCHQISSTLSSSDTLQDGLPLTTTAVGQFCAVNGLLQGCEVWQGCSECYCACCGAAVKWRAPCSIAP